MQAPQPTTAFHPGFSVTPQSVDLRYPPKFSWSSHRPQAHSFMLFTPSSSSAWNFLAPLKILFPLHSTHKMSDTKWRVVGFCFWFFSTPAKSPTSARCPAIDSDTIYLVRSRRVPSAGASIPVELGRITLPAHECVH